jgi:inner membrane protein
VDSLSQIALGAAVSVAVMGRRTAVWKAALWGGVCGTLPDLDAFIDHGDPVSNMTLHRAESHALFWQTVASPLLAVGVAKLSGEMTQWRRWWLAVWLALVTHPLLDAMTVYGTQLLLPFTNTPYGLGSIFIIDPLYTVPLLLGTGVALARRGGAAAYRWNLAGLLLSTAYLGWSALAQQQVRELAIASLRAQGLPTQQVLVTPTPFNTVLWRVVSVEVDANANAQYHEGFYSLLDPAPRIAFDAFDRGSALYASLSGRSTHADRIAWFSHGFFKVEQRDDTLRITDLRMGQEPVYTFAFDVARRQGETLQALVPRMVGARPDIDRALHWLWRRARGELIAPPRE